MSSQTINGHVFSCEPISRKGGGLPVRVRYLVDGVDVTQGAFFTEKNEAQRKTWATEPSLKAEMANDE